MQRLFAAVAVLLVAALVFAAGAALAAPSDAGWREHPAPWSEDRLLSKCVHRADGNYVVWLYNVPAGGDKATSDVSMFVVPLAEGRPC